MAIEKKLLEKNPIEKNYLKEKKLEAFNNWTEKQKEEKILRLLYHKEKAYYAFLKMEQEYQDMSKYSIETSIKKTDKNICTFFRIRNYIHNHPLILSPKGKILLNINVAKVIGEIKIR